jgi:hypothetical protein
MTDFFIVVAGLGCVILIALMGLDVIWNHPPALYLGLAAGAVYFVVGACHLKRHKKIREIVRDELRK